MMRTQLYIIWNDDHFTGVSILDEQRRGIVATINSVHYSIQQNQGPELLNPTLGLMKGYIGLYLKTEEMLLGESAYPEMGKVKLAHREFMESLNDAIKQATVEPERFLKFITDWWLNHTKEEFNQYASYLS